MKREKYYIIEPPTFKFYVSNVECTAEEGMTWYMWTESAYNNLNVYWADEDNLRLTTNTALTLDSVSQGHLIVKNKTYNFMRGSNVTIYA